MTRIYDDPAEFADDQLAGFLDLYADRVRGVHGGVVAHRGDEPQVAVVIGGGSGHYPAFCGTVGPGMAHGAVVGNIFTSPSAAQAYSVGRAADQGRGVIFSFGNYAGDVINFGIAAERLRADGIDARIVVVTDDIASAAEEERRRGIAGDFTVFKVMGAAAARGHDIDEVERLGRAANAATRTLGVAFSGCTMPGEDEPLFTVPDGHLGLGLGIHGEPGIRDVPMLPARELADLLVDDLLKAAPAGAPGRIGTILNGLGTTKYEELFLLWGHVARRLRDAGHEIVDPEVGELVTSLDMGGCSLTLMWLDDELDPLWRADAYTPAYRKASAPLAALRAPSGDELAGAEAVVTAPEAGEAARRLAGTVRDALAAVESTIREHENELGRIDAVAGDGDHGRGMLKGITAATARIADLGPEVGGGWLLQQAGQAWAERAGGTSGVLWGAALEAFGRHLGDTAESYPAGVVAAGVREFASTIEQLGGAQPGDKTLLDALLPFTDELERRVAAGEELAPAWSAAGQSATTGARDTAELRPRIGRARPLAEKSVGTPDAGATSMALIVTAVGRVLEGT
ncbi:MULTISPECIES: dihydroxyacetone kinase family protein [Pseudonocardia]|uniref:PTS-dependent dihydroxyacetone kinase, dihydroxyacetone-binding subunit DhaK n=2 Tax=Pseudonocardia TaxID=1847 RepID=A0A1Y2MXQ8_PSEAH|nr:MULTISPECIES: dihydroxyacetone kinase family protein [Pseudonocardia]OSY39428.1 PTS-dependent dihydroxyacetone kinase, dihydroxyacetone-binding subunit DhaK [Pseudonocardia autotrophica]TDN75334.1 homodimeric dihydroxyacetone kinase [Pseudonocardia autotrophica]BBF99280.1 D-erythrulose kinase [Pseudonocardia autotrophica]GEC24826.1 D-erythrulose kinase [Pseudonocardia saturnea]